MDFIPEEIIKILLAILIAGIIGIEREYHDKAAGFRTIILICVGATMFTIFSEKIAVNSDPARIAANIVTGIGFLGAGVIIRERGRVLGLTTAATIWLAAAIGMGIGSGYYVFTASSALIMLIVLWVFPFIENKLCARYDGKSYKIRISKNRNKFEELPLIIKDCGLIVRECQWKREEDSVIFTFYASGRRRSQKRFISILLGDEDIKEVKY